jgi:hypothetical protein
MNYFHWKSDVHTAGDPGNILPTAALNLAALTLAFLRNASNLLKIKV